MHQDQDGYLWLGTYDGLNLYNGKDTYVYRFELNNKNSLCSNIIHKISDAEPGFLWISTSLGINKFSLKERKVTESFPGYMECDLLASDSSGITLAICKENRISCYTPSSDGFRDLPREGVGPQTVRTLFAGTDGHFYLLLASGILKKLTPDFSDTTFNLLSEERQFHNKPILSAFYENNHIFIVDTDNKLYRQHVDGKGKEFLFDLPEMTKQYGNIIKICTFQSNVYIVFRNGNILDLSQPENTIKGRRFSGWEQTGKVYGCFMTNRIFSALSYSRIYRLIYKIPYVLYIQMTINPFGSGQKETVLSGYKRMTLTITKR